MGDFFLIRRYASGRSPFLKVMSLLSIIGVMLGVASMIVVLSIMSGLREELKEKILGVSPHIVVSRVGDVIYNWEEIVENINSIGDVVSAFPMLIGNAILKKGEITSSVVVQCLDIFYTEKALQISKFLRNGKVFGNGGICVGSELAKSIGIKVGDGATLISTFGKSSILGYIPNVKELRVDGIIELGIFDWDNVFVFMSLKDCEELFDSSGWVSSIGVILKNPERAIEVSGEIMERINKEDDFFYIVRPWQIMHKNLFSAMQLEKFAMTILLTIFIIIASFNIFSTITVLVRDKSGDIAILKTFGISSSRVKRIFTGVGVYLGIKGTVLGNIIGIFLVFILKKYKIIELPSDVYYISYLPLNLKALDVFLVSTIAIFLSFISSYYPALKASQKSPFDVLR